MSSAILSIVSGVAGMLGWGLYDFLGGVFAKQIGPFKSFFWSQLAGLATAIGLAVALATSLSVPVPVILVIPLASVLYSAGYLFFFKGLQIGHVSIVAATMNLWAVFTMLFAFLFLGQRLSATQSLGVLLILAGVALASTDWSQLRQQGFRLSSGVREAVLGAFFFGVFWNLSEIVSESIGWLLTTLLVKLGIVLSVLLFSLLARRDLGIAGAATRTKGMIVVMGVVEAAAVAAVNYGLTIGDAILITPIASALSIVTIALAILILKDRVTKLQGLGMGAAIAGIVVTAF